MSISVLQQVYDEVRRLAVAGSNLAAGDFRLKKLIPALEKAGEKAPVFAKAAQSAERLIGSTSQDSADALLELSTLVTAVLYTQGATGADGKLAAIPTTEMKLPSSTASARTLKPLLEALTTTGSGRLELIRDAYERGAFNDLRLVRPAIGAIDDPYGEIGDLIADKVLPMYGKTIYGEIRAGFNHKGRGGHVRRLRLMHRLDPEATRDLVEQSLESGSKEMTLQALACMKGRKEALPLFLEQARARSKEVRKTALEGLAEMSDKEAVDALIKAISGADLSLVAHEVSGNKSPQVLDYLLGEADKLSGEILTEKNKDKRSAALARFFELLACFDRRSDKKSLAVLSGCYDRRGELDGAKGKHVSGSDVNRRIAALMVNSGDKALQKRLVADADALSPEMFAWAVTAAAASEKPADFYEKFSPYLAAPAGKKKGRSDPLAEKQEVVREMVMMLQESPRARYYYHHRNFEFGYADADDHAHLNVKLDDRWLDAAVEQKDLDVVMALARPKHKPTVEFLSRQIQQQFNKRDWDYQAFQILETMTRIQHPEVVENFLEALRKLGKQKSRYYGYWWFAQVITALPKEAAAKIEELLPSLPERMVDELIPYLSELKARK